MLPSASSTTATGMSVDSAMPKVGVPNQRLRAPTAVGMNPCSDSARNTWYEPMMAVFAANSSRLEAVSTTDSFNHPPPNWPPSSEMKRSEFWSLTASGTRLMASKVSTGEVAIIVATTRRMPFCADSLIGNFIAGDSWLMLSRPENASHAPEKPTRKVDSSRSFASARFSRRRGQWKSPSGAMTSATTTTTRFTTKAAPAMSNDNAALSRIPTKLTAASRNNARTANGTMWCSTTGAMVPR
jgi:hypothetical protein